MKITWVLLLGTGLVMSTLATGQRRLNRHNFQPLPFFEEEFAYRSAADAEFQLRWVADHPQSTIGKGSEYYRPAQLELLPAGLPLPDGSVLPGSFLKIKTTRLSQAQRDTANAHTGRTDIVYASGKLTSCMKGDPIAPADPQAHRFEGFTYGLFEIRCKLPGSGRGIAPAFWLNAPRTEIDILDNLNDAPAREWQMGVLDWSRRDSCATGVDCWTKGTKMRKRGKDLAAEFNVYGAVWTPEAVTFYFNDRRILSVPRSEVATYKQTARLIVNVATQADASFASGEMVIDYIRVWKFKEKPVAPLSLPGRSRRTAEQDRPGASGTNAKSAGHHNE